MISSRTYQNNLFLTRLSLFEWMSFCNDLITKWFLKGCRACVTHKRFETTFWAQVYYKILLSRIAKVGLSSLKVTLFLLFFIVESKGEVPLLRTSFFSKEVQLATANNVRVITEDQFNQLQDNDTLWMVLSEPVIIEFLITSFQNLYVASPEVDKTNVLNASATLILPKLYISLAPLSVGETSIKVTSPNGKVKPLHVVVRDNPYSDLE
ncbi:MAG: hypothetical protein K2W99_03675 [Chthoniobacterales bacterium]|nr:hypothetical protein [Chthoniobacterales bacterium]